MKSQNFGFDDFEELVKTHLENSDLDIDRYFQGQNDMDINIRISNIVNQIRRDNNSFYQPMRLLLIK